MNRWFYKLIGFRRVRITSAAARSFGVGGMSIALRTKATGEARVISYNEFKDRIRRDEVCPQDQVQDRVLTNDQWWTVDNLRIFHRLSPVSHAKGPYLVAREKAEEEKRRLEEIEQRRAAEKAALARKLFQVEQSERDFMLYPLFEFLTGCNEQPLTGQDFAMRFTELPSFHPPLFVRASRLGTEWELCYRSGSTPQQAAGCCGVRKWNGFLSWPKP